MLIGQVNGAGSGDTVQIPGLPFIAVCLWALA